MMHFVRPFSIMRAYGVRLIVIEEARHYGKIVYIKNILQISRKEQVAIRRDVRSGSFELACKQQENAKSQLRPNCER